MTEKKKCGFAAMNPELVRAIARKGGKAAHDSGRAHQFTQDEAKRAGSLGGQETARRKKERGEPMVTRKGDSK